ncbi:hypothetical protein LUTEI9C_100038 [Luteimonas sp. 9C]|nr:hypothetical protein LUTEI9C_100038 [Luteimonas sp. 9C]
MTRTARRVRAGSEVNAFVGWVERQRNPSNLDVTHDIDVGSGHVDIGQTALIVCSDGFRFALPILRGCVVFPIDHAYAINP